MARTSENDSGISQFNEYVITNNNGTYFAENQNNGFQSSGTVLTTVFNAVISNIGTNRATITFGAGTFTTTTGLVLANSNIKVRGQGMGVTIISADSGSGVDSTAFFKVDPTQSATGYPLTANANAGDLTITMSSANLISSGLAAGDYFILYSSLSIDSEFTSRNQGELHKVISVNTGTGVITIGTANNGTHVYQTMTTANTASVAKLTMYQNISIDGITFTDAATSRPSTLSTGEVLMRFIDNLSITNCQFTDMFNAGLQIQQCMNTKISGCLFRNMKDVTPSANVFYGIVVRGASISTSITNCNFDNMRHGVTQGAGTTTYYAGTTRNMTVSNCSSISTYTSHFDVHQGAEGVSFVNNVMVGDDGSANGIQARSPVTITGNSVVGVLGKGISLFGNAQGSVVSGNDIKGCTDGIFVDVAVNKVNITGNSIHDGTRGISLSRTSATCTISIASPAVITKTAHGLVAGSQVTFSTTGALPTGLATTTVYYVMSTGLTVDTFQISATDGGSAVNTSGSQSGTQTLRYRGGNDSMITNNNIYSNSSVGISTNSQVRVKISGNTFRANSLPIEIINNDSICTAWQIDNNYFYNNTSNTPTLLGTSHYIYGNVGYNLALTAVATPFPASTGNVSNLASAQSFPTSTAVYTNIWSPKIFTITGGTVTVIAINGITTGLTAGSFKLDIGETISVTHSSNPTATVLIV